MKPYDLSILVLLYKKRAIDKELCISKKDIKSELDLKEIISDKTFQKRINDMLKLNYISQGDRHGRFKSYYINENGINYLMQLQKIKNSIL